MIAFLVECCCICIGMTPPPHDIDCRRKYQKVRGGSEWLRKCSLPLLPHYPAVDSLCPPFPQKAASAREAASQSNRLLGRTRCGWAAPLCQIFWHLLGQTPGEQQGVALTCSPFTPAGSTIMMPRVGMPAWEVSVFEKAFNFILSKW